jgi:hypothetical protein
MEFTRKEKRWKTNEEKVGPDLKARTDQQYPNHADDYGDNHNDILEEL